MPHQELIPVWSLLHWLSQTIGFLERRKLLTSVNFTRVLLVESSQMTSRTKKLNNWESTTGKPQVNQCSYNIFMPSLSVIIVSVWTLTILSSIKEQKWHKMEFPVIFSPQYIFLSHQTLNRKYPQRLDCILGIELKTILDRSYFFPWAKMIIKWFGNLCKNNNH